ncbi:unnamed protein product [Caretta caretta]
MDDFGNWISYHWSCHPEAIATKGLQVQTQQRELHDEAFRKRGTEEATASELEDDDLLQQNIEDHIQQLALKEFWLQLRENIKHL